MQINNENFKITNENNIFENFVCALIKEAKSMEEQQLVVDRIEDNLAICEEKLTGKMVQINLESLPKEIKEGNVIKLKNGNYEIDYKEQRKIEERIKDKMNNIWND